MQTIAITHDAHGTRVYPGDVVRRRTGVKNGHEYRKVVALTKRPLTKYVLVKRKSPWND